MRNFLFLLSVFMMFCACEKNSCKDHIEVVKQFSSDVNESSESLGWLQYDSIVYSDRSYAVYKLTYSPQNSLTEIIDQDGKTLFTGSRASECFEQYIVYNYDNQNLLKNLIVFGERQFDDSYEELEDWFGKSDGNYYETLRNKIASIDYSSPDTAIYSQINIEYDEDGDAIKIYKMWGEQCIKAPQDYKLDIYVEQCSSFWESDLHGGFYNIKIEVCPKNDDLREYTKFRYVNFSPVLEENYESQQIVRTVLHHYLYDGKLMRIAVTREDRDGFIIYKTQSDNDSKSYLHFWKDGLLCREQEISSYGTVYRENQYSYALPSTRVVVKEYKINFDDRLLKYVGVSETDISSIGKEQDEMNLLEDDEYYDIRTQESYYRSIIEEW